MNWKEFFKPTISKVIIFFLLLLIFGVPASVKQCATFDFGTGKFPCGPSRFGFHNPVLGSQNLDAATTYSYNFLAIALHLSIVYALLSLIYFYTREKSSKEIFI